jgi:tetratricopeptide (TPR) repeat protein
LEKIDKLEDARVNVENAIELDNTNKVYKQFFDDLKDKIKKLIEKTELYKKYLSNADNFLEKGDLEKALDKYEEAKYVFDNAEIIAKIIEVKRLVKEKEKQKSKITQLTLDAKGLIQQKDFQKAKSIINEISSIDKTNSDATKLLTEIDQILKQQETQFNDFVKSADIFFDANKYVEATNAYNQALILNPDSSYCMRQLENIIEKVHLQKVNKEKYEKITEVANNLFESQRWDEAQAQYEIALSLYPEENTIQNKIKFCMEKLKAQEDTFKGLISDAIFAKKEGKLKEALSFCETALKMRPNDKDVKNRLDKIKFEIQFDTGGSSKTTQKITNTVTKTEDNFFLNNKTTEKPKSIINDDFLSEKSNKTVPIRKEENNFILKKPKKTIDDFDDFLGKKK